jgi:hypothetical protein
METPATQNKFRTKPYRGDRKFKMSRMVTEYIKALANQFEKKLEKNRFSETFRLEICTIFNTFAKTKHF